MSEYWKSTPKYWCKHCSIFVRDTGLERANHESTGKHQSAIKRSLRDLHRSADQKERDKERAKREVDRLNGVVSGSGSGSGSGIPAKSAPKPSGGAYGTPPQQISQLDRHRQLEQLAELGVAIPTEMRGEMAMAGEWTVTSTRVVEDSDKDMETTGTKSRATGVKRERERTEEEKEQEQAIQGLFKKQRKWGVGSKTMPVEEDADLDALLSGPLVKVKKDDSAPPEVKTEKDTQEESGADSKPEAAERKIPPPIKQEPEEETRLGVDEHVAEQGGGNSGNSAGGTAVVFKKRKAKNIRQK